MGNTAKNAGAPGLTGSLTSTATSVSTATPDGNGTGMQIQKKDKAGKGRGKKGADAASPITSSVQENFRGFTYMGESMIGQAAGLLGQDRELDKAFDDVEVAQPEDEDDEWEDDDDAPQMMGRQHRAGSELLMD